jgi:hypothetical protein
MEEMAIRMNGEKVIRAKTAKRTADARANIFSSLERMDFMTHRLRTKRSPD